jgi:methyl-accepting chemotaxis protein
MKNVFTRMALSRQLISAFAAVSAFAVLVGAVGLVQINNLEGNLNDAYEHALLPVQSLGSAISNLTEHDRHLLRVIIVTDPQERTKQLRLNEDGDAAVLKSVAAAKASLKSDAADIEFRRFDETWPLYQKASEQIVRLVESGDKVAADDAFAKQATPAYASNRQTLRALIKLAIDEAKSGNDIAVANAKISILVMYSFIAAAVIVGLAIATFISCLVMRQVGSEPAVVAVAAQRIAEGSLFIKLEATNSDPTSIAGAIEAMRERLRRTVLNIRDAASSVSTLRANMTCVTSCC